MSSPSPLTFLVAVLFLCLVGCLDESKRVQEQHSLLTILLTEPLADSTTASLPAAIVQLALPVEAERCSSHIFTPAVTLIRADLDPSVKMELIPTVEGWDAIYQWFQNFLGSRTADQIKKRTERSLQQFHANEDMNAPSNVKNRKLILAPEISKSAQTIWARGVRPDWISPEMDVRITADVDSFRQDMAKALCEHQLADDLLPTYVFAFEGTASRENPEKPEWSVLPIEIPQVAEIEKTKNGIARKVIVKLSDALAYTSPDFNHAKNQLVFFRKYFVFEKRGEAFLIGEAMVPASIVGWARRQDVMEWNTNQAVFFINKQESGRLPVRVWQSRDEVGGPARADFEEDLDTDETSEPFPVLSRHEDLVEIAFLWNTPDNQKAIETGAGRGLAGEGVERIDVLSEIRRMDVVLVIDSTRSMGPYLTRVRAHLTQIVDSLQDPRNPVETHIGIVAFRDYEDRDVTFTTKTLPLTEKRELVIEFLEQLTPAAVDPGIEEAVFEGLYEGISGDKINWGRHSYRVMLLVGDAPPHFPGDIDTIHLLDNDIIPVSLFFDRPLERNISFIHRRLQRERIKLYALGIGARVDMRVSFQDLVGNIDRYIPLAAADQLVEIITNALQKELEKRNKLVEDAKRALKRPSGKAESEAEVEGLIALGFNPGGLVQTGWFKPDIGRSAEVAVHISKNVLEAWSIKLLGHLKRWRDGDMTQELKTLNDLALLHAGPGVEAENIGELAEKIKGFVFPPLVADGPWDNMEDSAKNKRIYEQLLRVLILLNTDKLFGEYGEGWVRADQLPGGRVDTDTPPDV